MDYRKHLIDAIAASFGFSRDVAAMGHEGLAVQMNERADAIADLAGIDHDEVLTAHLASRQ
jgi:hypothetical protein